MKLILSMVLLLAVGCAADRYTPYMQMQDEAAARHRPAAPVQAAAPSSDLAEGIALYGLMQSTNVWTQNMRQQVPPAPSAYQAPMQAPIVVPRGVQCFQSGAYTSCY